MEQPRGPGGVLTYQHGAVDIDAHVFGYGSLLEPASMATTLFDEHAAVSGPDAADLDGWRRVWNVAVPSGPGERRPLVDGSGTPYAGHVVSLGIEPAPGAFCEGAVYGVTAAGLALLDARELRYDRIDVTEAISVDFGLDRPVWTYRPKPEVVARHARLLADGEIVVTEEYLALVRSGMRRLGADAFKRYEAEPLPPCPVVDLRLITDW